MFKILKWAHSGNQHNFPGCLSYCVKICHLRQNKCIHLHVENKASPASKLTPLFYWTAAAGMGKVLFNSVMWKSPFFSKKCDKDKSAKP